MVVGEHDINDHSGKEVVHTIEFAHIHSRFIADAQYAYDIALIKLNPPPTFTKYVQPIDLPPLFEQVPVGSHCVAAGKCLY